MGMSLVRLATLALPMFVRSRKHMRYRRVSWVNQLLAAWPLYQAPVIASDSGYPVAFQGTAGKRTYPWYENQV